MRFADRIEAGRLLAERLSGLGLAAPLVLALPRGGVPVAAEIARALKAPLDVAFVRKIGAPYQPELAVAAVVDGGSADIIVNEAVVAMAGVTRDDIDQQAKRELAEIERRRELYLKGRPRIPLAGRTLIVVDDGVATGASVRAALTALRRRNPMKVILAIPVAPIETVETLQAEVDEVVCLATPDPFYAIGLHYRDFHQVPDDEVVRLLDAASSVLPAAEGENCAENRRPG
jgi:putative phosphoribosyl transferase